MTLVIVEVLNEASIEELRRNPKLRVVRVIEADYSPAPTVEKPRSWAGLLPKQTGERMLQEVAELRAEWS